MKASAARGRRPELSAPYRKRASEHEDACGDQLNAPALPPAATERDKLQVVPGSCAMESEDSHGVSPSSKPDTANATQAPRSAIRATEWSILAAQLAPNSAVTRSNSSQRAALAPVATTRDAYRSAFTPPSNTTDGSDGSPPIIPMRSRTLVRALYPEAEIALRHVPIVARRLPTDDVLAVGELAFEVGRSRVWGLA